MGIRGFLFSGFLHVHLLVFFLIMRIKAIIGIPHVDICLIKENIISSRAFTQCLVEVPKILFSLCYLYEGSLCVFISDY